MPMAETVKRGEVERNGKEEHSKKPSKSNKALAFWAYFTLVVSLVTLLLASLSSLLYPEDQMSLFLSFPDDLRDHYSKGKLIKVHPTRPNRPSIQIFAIEDGPRDDDAETVVLLHGLGSSSYSFRRVLHSLGSAGLRAIAIDFPGSGFSNKLEYAEGEGDGKWGGFLDWIWDVYSQIRAKGLFWGFDQLVETGQIPYYVDDEQSPAVGAAAAAARVSTTEMLGRIIGQVIDSLTLARPIHLVLHDSALGTGTNWVSANPGSVSSVTFIDSSAAEPAAFPFRIIGTPVLGDLLLGSRFMFAGLLRLCCSWSVDGPAAAEAYRLLLKAKNGRRAIAVAGKALNYSFDLGEWAGSEVVKDLAFQVLWSNTWSDRWIEEGRRVSAAIPQAKFAYHSGGRWPQEDAAEEIAGMIAQFVSSLPKSIKEMKEDSLPEHIKEIFNEGSGNSHHHHRHHNHVHGHGHEHAAGYVSMYGLGQGWEG